jgi:hypothetical protein
MKISYQYPQYWVGGYRVIRAALRHYTIEAIEEILIRPIGYGKIRLQVRAWVGYYRGDLLEIFYDENAEWIFHCDQASKVTLNQLGLRNGQRFYEAGCTSWATL